MRYIAYMPMTVGLRWLFDGAEIDVRMLALMRGIAERGSLQQACGDAGLSYRHAWELLGRLESAMGERLVQLERGRGARLTAPGARLAEMTIEIETRLQAELKRAATDLNRPLGRRRGAGAPLRVCASHDLALDRLVEALVERRTAVEMRFQGSVDALVALARNRCDIAGFHVPELPGRQALLEPYRPWLKGRTLRFFHFADRKQGLMVARDNPLRIATLADLARTHARFVNRQPGSGTRLFFDALLAAHRVRPAQINGYRHEEFTHVAVAAMIASGAADAAFGIEAAAAQQGLAFVPLASERYFLAMRDATASGTAAQALLKALESRWFRNLIRDLPGYALPARVVPMPFQDAFVQH